MRFIKMVGFALVLLSANVSNATLVVSGENALSDGVMEYLTMDEVGNITRTLLESKLALGVNGHNDWRLGTRAEFHAMVKRNLSQSFSNYGWGDLFLSNGDVLFMHDDVYANLENPELSLMRSGDAELALELKNMILLFDGYNADPAFVLYGLGTADLADQDNRYMSGLQAYYVSSTGTSISRNNTIAGPDSQSTRSLANEYILTSTDWFVVRTIPEPATLSLLLMGGLALLRDKRSI